MTTLLENTPPVQEIIPQRFQRKRAKGWRKPDNTANVTHPGKYGNPFDWQIYGKAEAVRLHREWLHSAPEGQAILAAARRELIGKNLMCYCAPDGPCHADNLLAALRGES